jgi:hypothetical protein
MDMPHPHRVALSTRCRRLVWHVQRFWGNTRVKNQHGLRVQATGGVGTFCTYLVSPLPGPLVLWPFCFVRRRHGRPNFSSRLRLRRRRRRRLPALPCPPPGIHHECARRGSHPPPAQE